MQRDFDRCCCGLPATQTSLPFLVLALGTRTCFSDLEQRLSNCDNEKSKCQRRIELLEKQLKCLSHLPAKVKKLKRQITVLRQAAISQWVVARPAARRRRTKIHQESLCSIFEQVSKGPMGINIERSFSNHQQAETKGDCSGAKTKNAS